MGPAQGRVIASDLDAVFEFALGVLFDGIIEHAARGQARTRSGSSRMMKAERGDVPVVIEPAACPAM
jgi:hypothetical protein